MSRKMLVACALLASTVALGGCHRGAGAAITLGLPSAARDPNLISEQELQDPSVRDLNVLEAVRRLRPNFLSDHGAQSILDPESGKVHASFDGIAVIALDHLSSIYAGTVVDIRFLPAGAAMQKFGGRAHGGPVIVVRTA